MRIELLEDDSFLFGGTPKNIVVSVTMDNGRKVKFPYSAERSMSALYEDIRGFCKNAPISLPERPQDNDRAVSVPHGTSENNYVPQVPLDSSNKIEREDIVRCVALEKRESSCDLSIGGEYRVLKTFRKDLPTGPNGEMQTVYDGYEVIDDNSKNPIRTYVFPHEIILLRKRTPPPHKTLKFEQIVVCAECGEPSALILDEEKDKYVGQCVKCSKPMEVDRAKPVNKTT